MMTKKGKHKWCEGELENFVDFFSFIIEQLTTFMHAIHFKLYQGWWKSSMGDIKKEWDSNQQITIV
jgi:hypothetical protein